MQPSQVICVYLLHYRLHLSVQSDVTATQKTHTHTHTRNISNGEKVKLHFISTTWNIPISVFVCT